MLLSIFLPFSDLRSVVVPSHAWVPRPVWPSPRDDGAHMRGIGSIRLRNRAGFEGWVGEDQLAVGLSSFRLTLPSRDSGRLGRIRLIRRASYFDGLMNGRFEILIATENEARSRPEADEFAARILSSPVVVRDGSGTRFFEGPLARATRAVPGVWSRASTLHNFDRHEDAVLARRCYCTIENCEPLASGRAAKISNGQGHAAWSDRFNIFAEVGRIRAANVQNELCLLSTDATVWNRGRASTSWSATRYLRSYMFRLVQDVEAVSLLLTTPEVDIEDDRAQLIMNEYTRHILRSKLRLSERSADYLVAMGYSAFESLYPARREALRARILASNIRPTVARKLLDMLEDVSVAQTAVHQEFHQEIIMGDKYENVTATGEGIAIGRGASASVRKGDTADISASLLALAQVLRETSDKDDAELQATLAENAAKKLEEGDEKTATSLLGTMAKWALDIAKVAGTAALTAFLKSRLG